MTSTVKRAQDQILTVAEVERRYPDEWVLLEITRDDKHHLRKAGRLIAHSPNRHDLDEPYERFRKEQSHARTAEFYTGALVSGDVVVII